MAFGSIVVKETKYEEERHILNLLLLFQLKIYLLDRVYKNNDINSFNVNN